MIRKGVVMSDNRLRRHIRLTTETRITYADVYPSGLAPNLSTSRSPVDKHVPTGGANPIDAPGDVKKAAAAHDTKPVLD